MVRGDTGMCFLKAVAQKSNVSGHSVKEPEQKRAEAGEILLLRTDAFGRLNIAMTVNDLVLACCQESLYCIGGRFDMELERHNGAAVYERLVGTSPA